MATSGVEVPATGEIEIDVEIPEPDTHSGRLGPGQIGVGGIGAGGIGAGRTLTRSRRSALVVAAFMVSGVVLFILYLGQARTMTVASDGASQVLQAWAMLHGNPLLRGWSLSDVSFYSTELPQYMLIEAIRGLNGDVVHVAAAMTYTLLVLGVGLLAKGRATGREGLIRALVASGILLAPPLGVRGTTWVVLNYPDHTGTQVPLLLIWLVLDRVRPRWWVPILIAVLLAWVQIADTMALYEGVVPIAVVAGIRIIRRHRSDPEPALVTSPQALLDAARSRLAQHWYELSLITGALASVYVATKTLLAIRQAGGFDFSPPSTSFSTISGMSLNIWPKLQTELIIFGANFFGQPIRQAEIPLLHLAGVALVIWAAAVAVRQFTAQDNLIMQLVTVTFVAVLAAYTFSFRVGAWEAIGLLPAGAVLAGRLLPERLTKAGLVLPLAAVLACYGLLLYDNSRVIPQPDATVAMANWLRAHHLTYGLGRYWHANSITLDSGGKVVVRAVTMQGNQFVLTHWNTESSWYDPRRHDANFVILPADAWSSLRSVRAAAGPPARTYHLGLYVVMVWHKNLLDGPIVSGRVVRWDVLAEGRLTR